MRKFFSKLLCRLGIHRWEWGPGECCSSCGVGDWFFGDAADGLLAVNRTTLEEKYFPKESTLPNGWSWKG